MSFWTRANSTSTVC